MFGSDILEVAVGLCFIFGLASLVCTAVKEALEVRIRERADFLKQAIGELLNGPGGKPAEDQDWVRRFYTHPLINNLYLGAYNPQKHNNLPSFIPPGTFATALLDLVRKEAVKAAVTKAETKAQEAKASAQDIEDAKARARQEAEARFKFDPAKPLACVSACVQELPDGSLKESLTVVLSETNDNLVSVKHSLETWFNNSMDRVGCCYKRQAQRTVLVIATIATLMLNLNTVTITKRLVNDSVLRKAVAAQAEAYAKLPPTELTAATATNSKSSTNTVESPILKAVAQVTKVGLPLGWEGFECPGNCGGWIALVGGYLATIFAISLGAPFWFDLLNKAMELRGILSPQPQAKKTGGTGGSKSPPSPESPDSAPGD